MRRRRLPQAAKMALASAAGAGGTGGSPTPVGSASLAMISTSSSRGTLPAHLTVSNRDAIA